MTPKLGLDYEEAISILIEQRDVLACGYLSLLRSVCEDLNTEGWDLSPALLTLYRHELPADFEPPEAMAGADIDGFAFQATRIDFPSLMSGPMIADTLRFIAHRPEVSAFENSQRVGVILMVEAFLADGSGDDEQFWSDVESRTLRERPDAIEIRQLSLVDNLGTGYFVTCERASGQMHFQWDGLVKGRRMDGNVIDALRELAEALLG